MLTILQLIPSDSPEGTLFVKEMLASPRSTNVWRQASQWLYTQAGEQMPDDWSRHATLKRFIPEKASIELVSKPPATPKSITQPLPLARAKSAKATPIKPTTSNKSTSTIAQATKKPVASKDSKKVTAQKPAASSPANPSVYIVQEGDSLWKIAQRFGVKVDDIKKLNNLKSDALKKGVTLKLPKRAENSSRKTKS